MDDVENLKKQISALEQKLALYEQHGAAKLYYSLNRKMNEMADMLNKNSLKDISVEDGKDKSFERVVKLLENSEKVANCTRALGTLAGITGDEDKDIARKPFIETVATKRD